MLYQINRLGSRPNEFHPVKSLQLFDSEESAESTIQRLEAKSLKRSKYGPAQYVALPVKSPDQSQDSYEKEYMQRIYESRNKLFPHGFDEGNYRDYVLCFGGSEALADKVEIWLHASQSITIPDFPEDQMEAMDALLAREDLDNYGIVQEMAKILL